MNIRKWKRPALLAGGLLLGLALLWIFWPDRQEAKARELQAQLFSPEARTLPPEQRQAKWQEFRQTMERLPAAARQRVEAEMGKRQQQEIARYFTLSPQDRVRYLDDQIRRMEQRRRPAPAPGTSPRAAGQPSGRPASGATAALGGPGGAAGARPQGGSPGGRGPGGGTVAERDQRRQRFLDAGSPAARAQFSQYMKELNARRTQLGLPAGGRGFGPPR